jgi:hypothetical protein
VWVDEAGWWHLVFFAQLMASLMACFFVVFCMKERQRLIDDKSSVSTFTTNDNRMINNNKIFTLVF